MRNLPGTFTMRKSGQPSAGENWFRIVNKKDEPSQVYIYDEIGFWGVTASDFAKQLLEIDNDKIDLHLNSPGGEVFDGLAIYNAIKTHKAEVTVYVDALAASAASFIAQAGDKIIMARNAQMMIHDGIGICFGNEQDMLDTAETLNKISNNIADIYAQRAGGTVDEWRGFMRAETWYSGQEAVDAGLADEITSSDDKAEKEKNKWDLSFFNYAGREQAESPVRVRERLLVTNRAKEIQVPKGTLKNQDGSETQPPAGETQTGGTPPSPAPQQEPNPETQTEETPPEAPNTPDPDPAPASQPEQPSNQAGVMIDGKMVTDWQAIRNHINALQTAQTEREQAHRREFVENLSKDNKILATQVDSLTAFALTLSPEQFSNWSASYDSAPSQSLFENHGHQQQNSNSPASVSDERNDRIEVLQGTISMLERTMTPEQVKKTSSYAELQSLLGNNS